MQRTINSSIGKPPPIDDMNCAVRHDFEDAPILLLSPADAIAISQMRADSRLIYRTEIMPKKPYEGTRLTTFLKQRILELRPTKTQARVASEAGFVNANMVALIKNGSARLPIDRVPALAKALGTDPRRLLQLAIEQWVGGTAARTIDEIFGTIVTLNETAWLKEIRDASNDSDPTLSTRARSSLRSIFGR